VARRVPSIVVTVLIALLVAQLVLDWRSLRAREGAAGGPEKGYG
jgi:hypothetical protein